MPASQTFTYFTDLGGDYTADSPGFSGSYTANDTADGSDNNATSVGDSISIAGFGTGTLLGTTADGIVVNLYGNNYLFSNTYYSAGQTVTVNTSDPYVYCFLEGTQINTPSGKQNIETLKRGDKVLTSDGCEAEIRWMGYQTVINGIGNKENHAPVRIGANALGDNLPVNDLYLTGSHAILLNGKLINASVLCNGTTICQVPMAEMPDSFTYWHIETDAHEAIVANGLPAETFIDAPDRRSFDNYQEYVDFYGVERVIPEMNIGRITEVSSLPADLKRSLGIQDTNIDWADLVEQQNTSLSLKQAI